MKIFVFPYGERVARVGGVANSTWTLNFGGIDITSAQVRPAYVL